MTPLQLVHETYERLAPQFGRPESRVFDQIQKMDN